MERKNTLSTALVLSHDLTSLIRSDSIATAQNRLRVVADTGVITLGPNQVLRLTATGEGKLLGNLLLSFRRTGYLEQDNIYRVASKETTDPIRLTPGEAVSMDIPRSISGSDEYFAVRGVVLSNRRNVRVTAMIINTLTGDIISQIVTDNVDPDE